MVYTEGHKLYDKNNVSPVCTTVWIKFLFKHTYFFLPDDASDSFLEVPHPAQHLALLQLLQVSKYKVSQIKSVISVFDPKKLLLGLLTATD